MSCTIKPSQHQRLTRRQKARLSHFVMEASQSVSHALYHEDFSPSQSSPSALSSGKIAAIAVGTVLAVGMVCLLLLYPQILFAYLKKKKSQKNRSSGNKVKVVPLKDVPPQRPGPVRGNGGSRKSADDAESRRRRSAEAILGSTRSQSNQITIRRRSGSHVSINNNIHINLNDLSHPLPRSDSRRNRDPAPPESNRQPNAQRAPRRRSTQQSSDSPNGGIPPQRRRRHDRNPSSLPRVSTAARSSASGFWNVENWAQGIPPVQPSSSVSRRRPDSVSSRRERRPARRVLERDRSFDVPGAFPEDDDTVEAFELVTAPARVHVPGAPVHGDNGFWVRDERERWGRRQDRGDRRT